MRECDLINQIYGTIANPDRWSGVLVSIADHVGATGGMLAYCAPRGKGRSFLVVGRISEESSAIYTQHYVWNLWTCAMKQVPFGKFVSANSLLMPGAIFKTDFYADVLAPEKVQDAVNFSHRAMSSDGGVGGFGFCLDTRGAERAPDTIRRLQRLGSHLSRALDATMEVGRVVGAPQTIQAILNAMPTAALLLNRDGVIVHANAGAELLLNANEGISFDRSGGLQLATFLPAERAMLSRALALALDVAAGASVQLTEPVRITRPSGAGHLLVIPIPIPPPAFELWTLADTARVLVLIVDPSLKHTSGTSILRQAFGLTAAEARIAILVGRGFSGPRAAQALGISPATVKTHLARCFDKLGIRSQVELARILSALPTDASTSGDRIDQP